MLKDFLGLAADAALDLLIDLTQVRQRVDPLGFGLLAIMKEI